MAYYLPKYNLAAHEIEWCMANLEDPATARLLYYRDQMATDASNGADEVDPILWDGLIAELSEWRQSDSYPLKGYDPYTPENS